MAADHDSIAATLFDAAIDAGSWSKALLDLAHACHAQVGSMVLVDKSSGDGVGFCLGVEETWALPFVRRKARHVAFGATRVKAGAVFTDRMVLARRDFERSHFFETWAQPSKLTDYAGVSVLNDADRFVFVGLARGPRKGAFESEDLEALERLAPDVRSAARVWVALGAAEEARRSIEAAFDHIAHAVFLTDAAGKIKFANKAAAELLIWNGGLLSRDGELTCATRTQTDQLKAHIRAAAAGSSRPGRMILAMLNGTEPLTILVTPLSATAERPAPRAEVMVIAVGLAVAAQTAVEQLRERFGLTRVESRLASQIVKGEGLKKAALALKIAPTTARTHLNRIFDKTGARSQAALASLLTAALALSRDAEIKSSD